MPLVGALVVLALLDSTSVGTLVLPIWMLARPRVRVAAVLLFLTTIAAFYWLLGVLLFTVLEAALPALRATGDSAPVVWAQLIVGVALFLVSFLFDGPGGRWRRKRIRRKGRRSRLQRWQSQITGYEPRPGAVIALALGAGAVEAASMVPYLAALGLLAAAGTSPLAGVGILLGYVVVMVAPALLLTALRIVLARRIEPFLTRMSEWFSRNADSLLAWTLGVAGFLVANDALGRLRSLGG